MQILLNGPLVVRCNANMRMEVVEYFLLGKLRLVHCLLNPFDLKLFKGLTLHFCKEAALELDRARRLVEGDAFIVSEVAFDSFVEALRKGDLPVMLGRVILRNVNLELLLGTFGK